MTNTPTQAAIEAAARALVPGGDNERVADFLWPEYLGDATAAIEAYRAAMREAGFVEASTTQIANLSQQVEALAYENGTLKAIVQGWHYLAVGPDEMGDYYTHKQLVKLSEPYASPALKALSGSKP